MEDIMKKIKKTIELMTSKKPNKLFKNQDIVILTENGFKLEPITTNDPHFNNLLNEIKVLNQKKIK